MKNTYYFSHDCNAARDPKILAMRKTYGTEGYGWYWIIVEAMAESDGYKLSHAEWQIDALAMALVCDCSAIQKFIDDCINKYQLFESDGKSFWSTSLLRRLERLDESRYRRSIAGKKGAQARWVNSNAIATPKQSDSSDMAKNSKGKESKGKESKVNNDPPLPPKGKEKLTREERSAKILAEKRKAAQELKEHWAEDVTLERLSEWVFVRKERLAKLSAFYKYAGFPEPALQRGIDLLDGYLANNPDAFLRYSDHCRVLTGWVVKEVKKEFPSASSRASPRQEHGHKITEKWREMGLINDEEAA